MRLQGSRSKGLVSQGSPHSVPPHNFRNSEPLPRAPQPGGVHPRLMYPLPGDVASGRSRATWPCFCSGNSLSRMWKGPGSPDLGGTHRAGRCVLEGGDLQRREDPAQTLSLPTALGEVLIQQLAAGLQDERNRDDRHFPENIHQPGRLPFSCDPLMPWEIRLSRAASCYPLTFLLSVPEVLANLMLRKKKKLSKRKNTQRKK